MRFQSSRHSAFITIGLAAIILFAVSNAAAQQQQYANAYAYWTFGDGADDIENVEQRIWIAKPAPGSQWVVMWSWVADPAHGGYFGFNTDDKGGAQALFSLWNADKASGGKCQEFGGEGVGWSCRAPFELRTDTVYRLRLSQTKTDDKGVWWGGWIYAESGSETSNEVYLGEMRVIKAMNRIRGNSIMNFSEYYGKVVKHCSDVPFSILVVAPPSANRNGDTDEFARTSSRNGGSDPKSNPCKSGTESQGSLFKVEPFTFFGTEGSVIYFGGKRSEHKFPEDLEIPGN